ncbi:hypothetical protein BJ878DRAFT_429413 [Calycina marina]|uniref:Uncharacterized protein n=1 Tax=Calycina marina TaxID=1763456 RepID=A0A9P8CBR2_9HELO|nr:hypothetical protein BJ878DRAFT_429413 [Calycina marina]
MDTAISIAGDDLTFAQAKEVFEETLGRSISQTFGAVGGVVRCMTKELDPMFAYFAAVAFGADIPTLR